jgi:hypothetical protein
MDLGILSNASTMHEPSSRSLIVTTALSSTISDFGLKIGKPKRALRTKKIPIIAAATRRSAFFREF